MMIDIECETYSFQVPKKINDDVTPSGIEEPSFGPLRRQMEFPRIDLSLVLVQDKVQVVLVLILTLVLVLIAMFAFITALLVAEIVILFARQAIERCKGDAGPRSMQVYFRTNLVKTLIAAAVLIPVTQYTGIVRSTEWISIFVAYLTLRALSFLFNGQIFRGFTDQLCSTPRYVDYHNAYLFCLLLNK